MEQSAFDSIGIAWQSQSVGLFCCLAALLTAEASGGGGGSPTQEKRAAVAHIWTGKENKATGIHDYNSSSGGVNRVIIKHQTAVTKEERKDGVDRFTENVINQPTTALSLFTHTQPHSFVRSFVHSFVRPSALFRHSLRRK